MANPSQRERKNSYCIITGSVPCYSMHSFFSPVLYSGLLLLQAWRGHHWQEGSVCFSPKRYRYFSDKNADGDLFCYHPRRRTKSRLNSLDLGGIKQSVTYCRQKVLQGWSPAMIGGINGFKTPFANSKASSLFFSKSNFSNQNGSNETHKITHSHHPRNIPSIHDLVHQSIWGRGARYNARGKSNQLHMPFLGHHIRLWWWINRRRRMRSHMGLGRMVGEG